MAVFTRSLSVTSKGPGDIVDLTFRVEEAVKSSGIRNGVVHVFAPHATAAFGLTEFEPALAKDISQLLEWLVPKEHNWRHVANAHSHLRSMILAPEKMLPVREGRVVTGTWQSLFFIEAGLSAREVRVEVTVIGE